MIVATADDPLGLGGDHRWFPKRGSLAASLAGYTVRRSAYPVNDPPTPGVTGADEVVEVTWPWAGYGYVGAVVEPAEIGVPVFDPGEFQGG